MSLLYDTYTIWYREMMRYKRNRRYMIAQLIFPLILIFGLGLGFNNIITLPNKSINYIDFLSSGVLVFTVASGALGGGFNLIEERTQGFLKTVIVAPISRFSIILGKIAARITFSAVQVTLFVLLLSFVADIRLSHLWLTILTLMVMAALFVCVGVVLASFLMDLDAYRMVTGFIMLPIYFFSGIFFPISTLPVALQVVGRINPLTYAVDLFRFSLLGTHEFPLVLDAVLLGVLALVVFFVSAAVFDRKFRE
jgi:ABC-2 type transport system permease protein